MIATIVSLLFLVVFFISVVSLSIVFFKRKQTTDNIELATSKQILDYFKLLVKSFTFWFVIVGILIVTLNLLKFDDLGILMIGINPILNILSSSDLCDTIADIPYLWQILSIATMTMYGLLLDGIKCLLKRNKAAD